MLRAALGGEGFRVLESTTAKDAYEALVQHRPNVLLLDLGLPDASGLEIVKTIRPWFSAPIIIISASGDEEMMVDCLESGANDYVRKPFGVAELKARIRVALRPAGQSVSEPTEFECEDFRVDFALRKVWVRGKETHLPPLEYKLLATMIKYGGKVVTSRQLLSEVWGPEYTEDAQNLRVYVGYLRKKLEEDAANPRLILTEHRIGYRLCA